MNLRRSPADGSGPTDVLAADVNVAVVHGRHLYFATANATELRRIPVDDARAESEFIATTPAGISSIAVDAASVFWMDYGTAEMFRQALPGPARAGDGVPDAWTCQKAWYDDGKACDCGCGAPDPDCEDPSAFIYGCGAPHAPGEGVECVGGVCPVPVGWHCADLQFADGTVCNCECGANDPDCWPGGLHVAGCPGGNFSCQEDACVEDPSGAQCDASHFGTHDGCDCGCGGPDPDCADSDALIFGCGLAHAPGDGPGCEPDGGCEAPTAWACSVAEYQDFGACDCECGAVDPDCIVDLGLPIASCGAEQRCPDDACTDIIEGDVCGDATAILEGSTAGSWATAIDDYDVGNGNGAACEMYGTPGRDVAYRVDLAAGDSVTFTASASAGVDVALYLVTSCAQSAASCVAGADEGTTDQSDTLSYTAVDDQLLFLVIDQYGAPLDGTYTVQTTFTSGS